MSNIEWSRSYTYGGMNFRLDDYVVLTKDDNNEIEKHLDKFNNRFNFKEDWTLEETIKHYDETNCMFCKTILLYCESESYFG